MAGVVTGSGPCKQYLDGQIDSSTIIVSRSMEVGADGSQRDSLMDLLDFFIGEVSENNASNKDPVNTIAAQLLTIWCLKLAICPWKNLPNLSKFTN